MAKSLEETLKDLRAGGYSEGGIRNWLVNKGFPSVKVDKAMAMRIAKDSDDRRSRLHHALDCVLDSRRAVKDAYPADTRQKNMDSYEKLVWKLWNMHNKSYADVAKQLGMSTQKVRAMIDYLRGKVDEY
jgi:hypothetical protein